MKFRHGVKFRLKSERVIIQLSERVIIQLIEKSKKDYSLFFTTKDLIKDII